MTLWPKTVYRLFDADGDLLYVGNTGYFEFRLKQHLSQQPWADEIDHWEVSEDIPFNEAWAFERQMIIADKPRYNADPNDAGRRGIETAKRNRAAKA